MVRDILTESRVLVEAVLRSERASHLVRVPVHGCYGPDRDRRRSPTVALAKGPPDGSP